MSAADDDRLRDLEDRVEALAEVIDLQRRRIEALEQAPSELAGLRDFLNDADLGTRSSRAPGVLITAVEAGRLWGSHPKTVERWCRDGRVAGARKRGRVWVMPHDAEVTPKQEPAWTPHQGRARNAIPASDQAGRDAIATMRARTKTKRGGSR
jgi:hypothetical protein